MDPGRDGNKRHKVLFCYTNFYGYKVVWPHNSGSEGLIRPGSMSVGAAECMLSG